MSFYCGIDLSARASQLCVINQQLARLIDQKPPNDLDRIIRLLEPYRADLKIVVESTFNWYWLVDGLRAAGFDVCLAHTLGLYMITGAKVKTDRRDAFSLAKLLLAGVIPPAYIYPPETRPVRESASASVQCWSIAELKNMDTSATSCCVKVSSIAPATTSRESRKQS